MTEAFAWANENTISTIASCLAVHVAVQHFDGIDRRSLDEKCFGIFDFAKVSSNPLLKGIPARLQMPHSRWNGIEENALLSCGYEILANSSHFGVDMFVRSKPSMFVFFQGHPEYEAWTLLGEFRRDIARFLCGELNTYPAMPVGYFDDESAHALNAFRECAISNPRKELMAAFPIERLTGTLSDPWHYNAVLIYSNWLQWMAVRKAEASQGGYRAGING